MSGRRKTSIWAHNLLINAHDEVVGQRQEASPNNYFSSLLGSYEMFQRSGPMRLGGWAFGTR